PDCILILFSRPSRSTLFPYTTLFRSLYTDRARHGVLSPWRRRGAGHGGRFTRDGRAVHRGPRPDVFGDWQLRLGITGDRRTPSGDRKSTRLNSSHRTISYADCCLKKK